MDRQGIRDQRQWLIDSIVERLPDAERIAGKARVDLVSVLCQFGCGCAAKKKVVEHGEARWVDNPRIVQVDLNNGEAVHMLCGKYLVTLSRADLAAAAADRFPASIYSA